VYDGHIRYAEVLYFCNIPLRTNDMIAPVALVTLFSEPDPEWLQLSHGTYRLCQKGGEANITVVPVQALRSLIAMVPDKSQHHLGDM
jgi:hypothetical protein